MPIRAKIYVYSVIAAAGIVVAASLPQWHSANPLWYAVYLAFVLAASAVKLRLPGINGAFSVTFLPLLFGLLRFSYGEMMIAASVAGIAQTVLNVLRRPLFIQIAFNAANVILSAAACSLFMQPFAGLAGSYAPAAFCGMAALYFLINTVLVSGILSLLEGKPLAAVCETWYVWSFAYYLLGAAVVGLTASVRSAEAWLILIPILYLVHFYYGLSVRKTEVEAARTEGVEAPALSRGAKIFLYSILLSGFTLLAWSWMNWTSMDLARFATFFLAAAVTATWKIRLPGMTGTLSVGFVIVLFAAAELTLPELLSIAAVSALMQSVWRPKKRPMVNQVLFNSAAWVLSAACAYGAGRFGLTTIGSGNLSVLLIASTFALYGANILLVSAMVCLAEGNPLSGIWRNCCFWSFPYYLVGTAVSGVMVLASRSGNWMASLMVVAVMAMVYVSYRAQVRQAVAR